MSRFVYPSHFDCIGRVLFLSSVYDALVAVGDHLGVYLRTFGSFPDTGRMVGEHACVLRMK